MVKLLQINARKNHRTQMNMLILAALLTHYPTVFNTYFEQVIDGWNRLLQKNSANGFPNATKWYIELFYTT